MVSDQRSRLKTVCVIGAGPSGLVAARELRKEFHKVMVMEQSHDIGGQWLYNYQTQNEQQVSLGHLRYTTDSRVHSSIYASLRLTSPREILWYSDFPFVVKKGETPRGFQGTRSCFST
ncbi:hypothetical protein QQ045_012469 [Rhodiola kirilowii]